MIQALLEKSTDTNAQSGRYSNTLQAALLNSREKEKDAKANAQGGKAGYRAALSS